MSRLPRRMLGRGVYHVYNRSANNMWILETEAMKECFLNLAKKYADTYQLNIYHYCIMSNHFHFAIEGDIREISSFISGLCSRYTLCYHAMTKSGYGSIWQGRYKSVLVQKEGYLARLGRYIELNPIRAKLVTRRNLASYKWSSARCYLRAELDELVSPLAHPFHRLLDEYSDSCRRRYAEYLQMSYNDDVLLFRSDSRQIGDEGFLTSVINTIAGRKKLSVGRPKKNSASNSRR